MYDRKALFALLIVELLERQKVVAPAEMRDETQRNMADRLQQRPSTILGTVIAPEAEEIAASQRCGLPDAAHVPHRRQRRS